MRFNYLLVFTCLFVCFTTYSAPTHEWVYKQGNLLFTWDILQDKANLTNKNKSVLWKGSLLPSFWLQQDHVKRYVKATVNQKGNRISENELVLNLDFENDGTGSLTIEKKYWGLNFRELNIKWKNKVPKIISMYFGTSLVKNGRSAMPDTEFPFWPDWEASGFCMPGAKAGPAQSYFRNWDFGQTEIALGNFGPSLGTPYAAAFPRPVLFFGMGQDSGWIVFGAGSLPDAPMSLKIQTTLGCIKYLYREDLWSNNLPHKRTWQEPLKITFGNDSWQAFKNYYASFPAKAPISLTHQKAIWNTWGNWRLKEYAIKPLSDFGKEVGAEILVTDDPWETSQGSGKPNYQRFPLFDQDLAGIRNAGIKNGIWETLGWVKDTTACGLSTQDLIVGQDGKPCRASWNFNPFSEGYYCIDISSQKARQFLEDRTIWTMQHIKPDLIKLDFGYGMPNPNMGVPRDPKYRGEKYCYELIKIIADAAKSIKPDVTIMYYGINPLYTSIVDMVSLDDQGDLWYATKEGHAQWSIWASLLSDRQVAINGSSSYDWSTDDEVILNTFVLGSPGGVLSTHTDDKREVPEKFRNRRLAVNKWYRKTIQWNPLWLNSNRGNFKTPPVLNCWGRMEKIDNDSILTVLALREENKEAIKDERITQLRWTGRWAIVSVDDTDIFSSSSLALVPFDEGNISIPYSRKPKTVSVQNIRGSLPFNNWEWKDGRLYIQVTREALNSIAGI
ncbi:MAG TPA: hypothetical protein VK369_10295, partial [Segetibacter sp.]|nr:hypothetical protein [Segetibacter sp.]